MLGMDKGWAAMNRRVLPRLPGWTNKFSKYVTPFYLGFSHRLDGGAGWDIITLKT